MCIEGGCSATWTQMYLPDKLFTDVEYRERALRDLQDERDLGSMKRPTIVQLGGRNVEELVTAARIFEPYCDGIGIEARHALRTYD